MPCRRRERRCDSDGWRWRRARHGWARAMSAVWPSAAAGRRVQSQGEMLGRRRHGAGQCRRGQPGRLPPPHPGCACPAAPRGHRESRWKKCEALGPSDQARHRPFLERAPPSPPRPSGHASGAADFPPPESILPACRGAGEVRARGEKAGRPHSEVSNGLVLALDVS